MHVEIAPRGILEIDDARIIWKNFEGRGDKYNREGDRNFALVIDDREIYETLKREGWNVKERPASDDFDEPLLYLKVKVKFNDRGPKVLVVSGQNKVELDEEDVISIDRMDISSVDLTIRPYDWTLDSGKSGRTAYLQSIVVIKKFDRLDEKYAYLD